MSEQNQGMESNERDRQAQRIAYGVGIAKLALLVALLRLFSTPMTKELFGNELLPMPTWEWSLLATTPGILIYLARRPEDWQRLSHDLTIIKWALCFYLTYGLAFATFQGEWVLWFAVLTCSGGLAGIWYLNRRELTRAI
ncbi:hypothetical protein ACFYRD_22550 [Streptomyces hirsutus]|uniref:hypothetical protein n=1 Tax=Streptomyces hirsutus TaxID=35620 RepID=UPI0036781C66